MFPTLCNLLIANCEPQLCNYMMQAKWQLSVGNGDIAPVMPKFEVKDLESLDGKYDTVYCGVLRCFNTVSAM